MPSIQTLLPLYQPLVWQVSGQRWQESETETGSGAENFLLAAVELLPKLSTVENLTGGSASGGHTEEVLLAVVELLCQLPTEQVPRVGGEYLRMVEMKRIERTMIVN